MNKKMNKKTVKFIMLTIILLLVTTFSVTGTVLSQNKGRIPREPECYKVMEKEYLIRIREELNCRGYKNAGITMTKIVREEGTREYTVLLHHKKIDRLDKEERTELTIALAETEFPAENCSFSFEFLE